MEQYSDMHQERQPRLSEGIDFYKLTMGQIALEKFKGTEVTFTFKNRDPEYPISEYVPKDELLARLDEIRENGFSTEEVTYFAGLKASDGSARFDELYLDYLAGVRLPEVSIDMNELGDLSISTTGDWAAVSLWETVVMSECNELYYQNLVKQEQLDPDELYTEGDRRLSAKIDILSKRPDIKFADFGTRRRNSAVWQEHTIGRLVNELPDNFVGTSNPWLAYKFGINPVGTYAHEMDMVYAALSERDGDNPLDGHQRLMRDWYDKYGKDLSIALTDTFTSDLFFDDFRPEQAQAWRGLRQDSGDPIEFGERAIEFYQRLGIDPLEKTIVFSDGLDIDRIVELADHFKGRVNILFGWGTTLMNDLGLRANNIVMKATSANGTDTVKLSDDTGKYTGPEEKITLYNHLKSQRLLGEVAIVGAA